MDAAIRELNEETGIDLIKEDLLKDSIVTNLCSYDMPARNKEVIVFLLDCKNPKIKKIPLHCESFFSSGKIKQIPEMDDFKWVKKSKLKYMLLQSQQCILTAINKEIKNA